MYNTGIQSVWYRWFGELTVTSDTAAEPDTLDVIEVATAMLMRNFELLRRRGTGVGELDRADYLLLRTLSAIGPSDIVGLAAALGLDPSTAGRQVSAMAAKGLIERNPSPTDKRRSVISPTKTGLARMRTTRTARRRLAGEMLADWPEADLRTLGEMFTRYNRTVAAHFLLGEDERSEPPAATVLDALLPAGS
jgi:DNA-binding MarR family transcriptional regulator